MNLRLLAFLIWIVFCIAMAAMHPPLVALAAIAATSVLALGLRWACRTMLQPPAATGGGEPIEAARQESR